MPIYEYKCSACGEVLEAIQKFSDEPLRECPECGKPTLEKLLSASAFRLKGGGWYETDFKTGNKKNLAGGGSDSGTSKSGASAGSSPVKSGSSSGSDTSGSGGSKS